MKNLLALIAASALAQDSPIEVTLTASDSHSKKGDSVVLSCTWTLDDNFDDYGESKFNLFWKEKIREADGGTRTETVVFYNGASDDSTYYYGHNLVDRVTNVVNFEDRNATLTIADLELADDDLDMYCEIHWNKRYEEDSEIINVYDNADDVELDELTSELEGREYFDSATNETVVPTTQDVAQCTIHSVYPLPESVVFQVGNEDMPVEVDNDNVTFNDDGTYTVTAVLELAPEGQYDQDTISCYSVAAPEAERMEASVNETFTLSVFYYTDTVTLTIEGDAVNMESEDAYSVIENNSYKVSCVANGNPLPEITINNHDGDELSPGSDPIAARTGNIQHISCTAENNDGNFTMGDDQEDSIELDVYYIEDVDLGEDETGEHGENFRKQCDVRGHPTPEVKWTKGDDDTIVENDSELDLGSLTYADAGEYRCTATNKAGSESDSFELTVDGPCIVEIKSISVGSSQESDSENGQASLRLTCSVQPQNNKCQIEWESEAEGFINTEGEISYDEDKGVSSLFFAGFEQFAEPTKFTCKATNDRGTETDEVMIDETREPACCQTAGTAALGTGAIVGIVIAIPAILIIIGAAVFFCRKRNDDKNECVDEGDDATEPEKEPLQADHDGEGGNAEDDAV